MFKIGTENDANRVQWIMQKLKEIPHGSRLLDAGAGECRFKPFCSHMRYVSQDFGQYNGGGSSGVNPSIWDNSKLDIVCDIQNIPEPDSSFDAILCTEVFEHIPEPLKALDELTRLTKQGGTLLITAPFTSATHFDPYHFFTGYSWNFYQHHLPLRGWKIEEIVRSGNFYQNLAQELRRTRHIALQDGHVVPWLYYPLVLGMLWVLTRLNDKPTVSNTFWPYTVFVRATKL